MQRLEQTLNESQAQYKAGIEALRETKEQYEIQRANGLPNWSQGRAELEQARIDLEEGQKNTTKAVEETNQTLADAKAQIDDAQEQLDSFDELKWYVFSRDDNPGYRDYESDTQRCRRRSVCLPRILYCSCYLGNPDNYDTYG